MKIEHVCPVLEEPIFSQFIGQGVMERKDFINTGNGLYAPTTFKWITIKVMCSHCNKIHEYALVRYPIINK